MTWHAPAISPQLGAYLLLALAIVAGLGSLLARASAEKPDPHAEEYGDIAGGRDHDR